MHSLINFNAAGAESGTLVALEPGSPVPFEIKRVFYIFGVQGDQARGGHANRNSQFLMVAVRGSCKVDVVYDGENKEQVALDSPTKGLWLDKMVWKKMHSFSEDAVLMVLSDHLYDKNEYIYDLSDLEQ